VKLTFETEQQGHRQWLATIVEFPGTLGRGSTEVEAIAKARELVMKVRFLR
jgi:predicted RNase H-like HicB family nuclease